ncbi:type IV secretory system conjugative DNA transfer family protein [Jannaschia rubra]|uniref:Conjugal transfer protein TraG n=1 Tax=Jannaschia rubra TaxID=282197 RepID=A0A0M6XX39_9RHOB|nr:type IV secretory system conjugative DNA transfer family protein [Jannaschia rubra]CTQ34861.1 Conjugal transfer protein TraG [Jannaschia rubra]SFG67076.1 type IV secretion system protein VirD4 [Jannaschia rubra]
MITSMESRWRYPLAAMIGLAGGAVLGLALATLAAMAMLREPLETFALAEPWFVRWSTAELGVNPAVLRSVWMLTLGPMVAFAALGLVSAWRGGLTDYDDAHFQSAREMRRNRMVAGLKRNGFVYGKLGRPGKAGQFVSATPDRFPHAIMIAPTGRGKNVGFVFPNLMHFRGSAVVLDVKGENFATTSVHRTRALGNKVWYFSPFDYVATSDEDGEEADGQGREVRTRTHRFNPLARIAALPSTEQQFTAINTMTDLFLSVESKDAESFFQAGRSLFVVACLRAIETGTPTIGEALRIMNGGGNKKESYRLIAEETGIAVVREVFLGMADQIDKILDSYVSVIRGAGLQLWLDPAVDRATSASDFDLASFRREAQTLYIAIQPEELRTLAPLVRLLFADAIASLQRAQPGSDEPHPVMFVLDEFDQLGRQPNVLQALKTIRSYGGRFFIVTQSIPGLESVYGETDRRALLAAAGVQIYMTPQDDRTAEVLSSALGRTTIVAKTRSQGAVQRLDESGNVSRRSEERPLISASETLRLDTSKVLILPEGQYPILADRITHYADRHFKRIDAARAGHPLPYPPATVPEPSRPRKMGAFLAEAQGAGDALDPADGEEFAAEAKGGLAAVGDRARARPKGRRAPPVRGHGAEGVAVGGRTDQFAPSVVQDVTGVTVEPAADPVPEIIPARPPRRRPPERRVATGGDA